MKPFAGMLFRVVKVTVKSVRVLTIWLPLAML